jgi:polar amino acid transport system permease protein
MGNFGVKIEKFIKTFIDAEGYKTVLEGLQNTLIIAILGLVIGLIIGTVIAIVKVLPRYKRTVRIFQKICDIYIAFFRGTPIVVQLLLGYYVLFPLLQIRISGLWVCVVIFGMNSAAYVAEIMRGGILAVDRGQLEAARALGLNFRVSMTKIVVPQALKGILPSLGNEFIALVKDTSVASFVAVADLKYAFQRIGDGNYEYMVPYLVMALIYIVMVLLITAGIRAMERRLARSDRNS